MQSDLDEDKDVDLPYLMGQVAGAIDEIKLRRMIAENEVAGTQQSDQQVNAAIAAVPPASGTLMNHLTIAVNRWQEYRRKLEALAIAWRN